MHGKTTLLSADSNGDNGFLLGQLGHVSGLHYSDTDPGGPEVMTCTLDADPGTRHEAFSVGRRVTGWRGASLAWEGVMSEPVPGDGGWALSADGAGTWGNRYRASWTGAPASNWTSTNVIQGAIDRGLPWQLRTMTGAYLTEIRDSSSLNITEFLDLITSPPSRTWRITANAPDTAGRQWEVNLKNAPDATTAVTRLLVATGPLVRTLAAYINVLFTRYMVTADKGNVPAVYDEVQVISNGVLANGTFEGYWDLGGAGPLSAGTVNTLTTNALAKYEAASWAGPFKVTRGQYLTTGGSPVDLGLEKAGETVRLIFTSGPYGGEIIPAPPIVFPAGKVEYNDDEGSLLITPRQSWRGDLGSVLSLLAPKAPA